MNLLCKLFGHNPPRYFDDMAYGEVIKCGLDGVGTEHAYVRGQCERCDEDWDIVRIHLPGKVKR